jgi:hypothetical protein
MQGMLTVLGRKLGLIRPSGVLEVFPPDAEEEWWTLGGPSLVLTEKGVPEYFWPDDSMWEPRAPQPCGEVGPAPAEDVAVPDKPEEGEEQAGAA